MSSAASTVLVVARAFPGHPRGSLISDAAQIAEVTSGEYRDHVGRIAAALPVKAATTVADAIATGVAAAEAALHTAT